jgi:hypothetical protein
MPQQADTISREETAQPKKQAHHRHKHAGGTASTAATVAVTSSVTPSNTIQNHLSQQVVSASLGLALTVICLLPLIFNWKSLRTRHPSVAGTVLYGFGYVCLGSLLAPFFPFGILFHLIRRYLSSYPAPSVTIDRTCWACGQFGHYAACCPNRRRRY